MSNIYEKIHIVIKKTLRKTMVFQVSNYFNSGFIEKTYDKSKCMMNLYGINIVPITYVQYHQPKQVENYVCKYTESERKKIHTV